MLDAKDAFTPKKRFDTTSNVRKASNTRIYQMGSSPNYCKQSGIPKSGIL